MPESLAPVRITLDPLTYKDLKIAVLERKLGEQEAKAKLLALHKALEVAAQRAGLDPNADYKMLDDECVVELL